MFHQVSQVLLSDVFIVVDPGDHGFEHLERSNERRTMKELQVRTGGMSLVTFSSVGMVSLSLAIRLDTCSMPRLRNSSLPTTSGKCCSVRR